MENKEIISEEKTCTLEKFKIKVELLKWFIGSVVLGTQFDAEAETKSGLLKII